MVVIANKIAKNEIIITPDTMAVLMSSGTSGVKGTVTFLSAVE